MDLKRKADYLNGFYDDDDFEERQLRDTEEDEEDEWEREASASHTSQKNSKPIQPNPYAIQADILTNQYETLTQLQEQMGQQLESLQSQLEEAEKEEDLQKKLLEDKRHHYSVSLDVMFELLDKILSITASVTDKASANITAGADYECYFKLDATLSKEIQHLMDQWKQIISNTTPHSITAEETYEHNTDDIAHFLLKAEFDLLDLTAQNSGLEAKIQSLTRDYNKLNGLPQIIPILKSEMDTYLESMKVTSMKLQDLEKETIRPTIRKLTQLNIKAPTKRDFFERELRLMYDLLNTLDRLYNISLKQRSIQQIVSYLREGSQTNSHNYIQHLQTFLAKIEREIDVIAELERAERPLQSRMNSDNGATLLLAEKIDALLADTLDKDSHNSSSSASPSERIRLLEKHKDQLEKEWEDRLQIGLEVATELNGLALRFKDNLKLYDNENIVDNTSSSAQSNLYSEFESKTKRLNATITSLEQKTYYTDEAFDDERALFSTYYTDPIAFENMHRDMVRSGSRKDKST